MKTLLKTAVIMLLFLGPGIGIAAGDGQSDQVSIASLGPFDNSAYVESLAQKDSELAAKFTEFRKFTIEKVKQLNRNLRFARSRMEVVRQPDGLYRARYHQIDDVSLGVKVSRSQSRSIPFVGVLSYREQVFEAVARTPDTFAAETFNLVQIIPNRHIFSYKKGAWD